MSEWAEALKKGDREAFVHFASHYGARLYHAGLALCRDHTEAQDLVQETFTEALRSAPRFEGRSAPYTWLYGIMRRRFLQGYRKKARFLRLLPFISREVQTSRSDEIAEAALSSAPVIQAVMQLQVKYREVLYLRYIENLRIAEIAPLVNVAEGTVKSRLHYALRRLRIIIESEPELAELPDGERVDEL